MARRPSVTSRSASPSPSTRSHPYLDERGIPPELRERFGLGYCEKGIMAGRVCIPIHNADGQIVAYAGRWVGPLEDLPEGKGKYELPTGFRKELELFNLHRVKDCKHLVVVEGFFGAIRLHGLRIPAVALMGTSVSVQQLELLAHANARHITVMLDGDEAGREAAEKVAGAIAQRRVVPHRSPTRRRATRYDRPGPTRATARARPRIAACGGENPIKADTCPICPLIAPGSGRVFCCIARAKCTLGERK